MAALRGEVQRGGTVRRGVGASGRAHPADADVKMGWEDDGKMMGMEGGRWEGEKGDEFGTPLSLSLSVSTSLLLLFMLQILSLKRLPSSISCAEPTWSRAGLLVHHRFEVQE